MCLRGTEDTRAITERIRQMVNYELTWTWETSGDCNLREALHIFLGFLLPEMASGSSGEEIQERAPHGFSGGRNNNHWGVILRAFSITKAHSPEGNAWPEFCLHPALTFLSWKRSERGGSHLFKQNAVMVTGQRHTPIKRLKFSHLIREHVWYSMPFYNTNRASV